MRWNLHTQLNGAVLVILGALFFLFQNPCGHSEMTLISISESTDSETEQQLLQAVKRNPEDGQPHFQLGMFYLQKGALDNALKSLQTASELLAGSPEVHHALGKVWHHKGSFDKAIMEYQASLSLAETPACHYDLGTAYHSSGKLKEALSEYEAALRLQPSFVEVHQNLGALYLQQGQLELAKNSFLSVLRIKPNDAVALAGIGSVQREQEKLLKRQILQSQTAVALKPGDAETHRQLGEAYFSARQLQESIEELEIASRLDPDSAQTQSLLQQVTQEQKQLQKAAFTHFMAKIQDEPQNPTNYVLFASLCLEMGEVKMALECAQEAVQLKSDFSSAWLLLGKIYVLQGEKQKGREAFKQAISHCSRTCQSSGTDKEPQLVPSTQLNQSRMMEMEIFLAEVYLQLGQLEKDEGNLPAAIESLREAVRLSTQSDAYYSPQAHSSLGEALLLQGQTEDAISELRKALRLKPDAVDVLWHLGMAYEKKGQPQTAFSFYRKFVQSANGRTGLEKLVQLAQEKLGEQKQ
ncbi:tetratricopeptide repeat protein [Candidatus Poribacteria bacterium]|nr:tetratricopeptide repeat protein [Candidatus Poribacteria bacterium]